MVFKSQHARMSVVNFILSQTAISPPTLLWRVTTAEIHATYDILATVLSAIFHTQRSLLLSCQHVVKLLIYLTLETFHPFILEPVFAF